MKKLESIDIKNQIYCEVHISFSTPVPYSNGEDIPEASPKSSVPTTLLSVSDFKEKFEVSDEIASVLFSYQNDVQTEFLKAVERIGEQSARYLAVKPYLNAKQYDETLIDSYIYQYDPTENNSPKTYLFNTTRNVTISFIILAITVIVVRNPQLNLGFDSFGGWILAIIWGATTALIAINIPKNYKTMKLLDSLSKSLK